MSQKQSLLIASPTGREARTQDHLGIIYIFSWGQVPVRVYGSGDKSIYFRESSPLASDERRGTYDEKPGNITHPRVQPSRATVGSRYGESRSRVCICRCGHGSTLACPMFISKCQGAHEEVKARPRFPPFITMAETRSRPDCFFAGRYQLGNFSCFFPFSFPTFASFSVSVGASTLIGRLRSAGQVGFVLFVHRECWDPRAMTISR